MIGNISVDRIVRPRADRREVLGGAGLHVALAATRSGLRATPISVIGGDLDGLPSDPRLSQLDLSAVKTMSGASATFTLTYDAVDNLVNVEANHGVAASLTDHAVQYIGAGVADTYHVCCRTPLDIAAILDVLMRHRARFSVDFVISSARGSIAAAASALPHARVVFVNASEYALLSASIRMTLLPAVVVSDGPRSVCLFRRGRLVATTTPPTITPVNPTGAGDALAGTFLAAQAAGLPDAVALRHAVTAASAHTTQPALALDPR